MRKLTIFLLACASLGACESLTTLVATEKFEASLDGDNVRPKGIQTDGSGSFTITSRSDTSALHYELAYGGLSSNATAVHIHGPAVDTVVGEILLDLRLLAQLGHGSIQLGTSGSATGSFDSRSNITPTVTGDSLFRLLQAGRLYVDVHTVSYGDGEIRGQIRR